MFPNLTQELEFFESHKEDILDLWFGYEIVGQKLSQHSINARFYREKFASKVFDFAMSVLHKRNEAGNCPVIGVMLMLFKKKNIPLSDIFLICVHFKNAMLQFTLQHNKLSVEMFDEIALLIDKNFEGVIQEYVVMYYNDTAVLQESLEKQEQEEIQTTQETQDESQLDSTTQPLTNAKTFLEEIDFDYSLLDELQELELDTLNTIDSKAELESSTLQEAANIFAKYTRTLHSLFEFEELAYTLTILEDLLLKTDPSTLSNDTHDMIITYIKAIISDLQSWRMSIFETQEAEDIHYLDKTLLSSIAQLQILLMPQEQQSVEEEIEFF